MNTSRSTILRLFPDSDYNIPVVVDGKTFYKSGRKRTLSKTSDSFSNAENVPKKRKQNETGSSSSENETGSSISILETGSSSSQNETGSSISIFETGSSSSHLDAGSSSSHLETGSSISQNEIGTSSSQNETGTTSSQNDDENESCVVNDYGDSHSDEEILEETPKTKNIEQNQTPTSIPDFENDADEDTPKKPEECEKKNSENFMKALEMSENNKTIFPFLHSLKFQRLCTIIIREITILHLCLFVLVFMYVANVPFFYLDSLWAILELFVPTEVAHLVPMTYQTFTSAFLSFFFELQTTKFVFETSEGSCEMYFFDFSKKLQEKFNSRKFRNLLLQGKKRIIEKMKNNYASTILQDINDGRLLRYLNKNYFSYQHHFPFMIFVDGVSPFKHSSEELIPIYLVNLQLPINERFKLENIILVALLARCGKWNNETFFNKLVERLNEEMKHFDICIDGTIFPCEARVITIIVDTKERESMFNFSSGYKSLHFCDTKKKYVNC